MAHLTCVKHGRRAFVTEHPKSSRKYGVIFQVMHRGDREKCNAEAMHYGKHEVSLTAVVLRMIKLSTASESKNWTVTKSSSETRPTRQTRRARRR